MPALAHRLGNTPETYGSVAKTFHWLTALLIFTAFPLGLMANGWPFDSAEALETKFLLFSLHKTVGVTVFFVALLRIAWAIGQPKPGALNADRKLESFLAALIHWLLYGSLVLVPLSGWLYHAATDGFAPILWPLGQSLPLVPKSEVVADFFQGCHLVFTKVLAAAILLHVAGALKHRFIDHDQTLARMLPGQTDINLPAQKESRAPLFVAVAIYLVAMAGGAALGMADRQSPDLGLAPAPLQTAGWTVREGDLNIVVQQSGKAVEGHFSTWTAAIDFDPDTENAVLGNVEVDISIPSLTLGTITQQALADDFFAAETFPMARFSADILSDSEVDGGYIAAGTLSLKGLEMPVILPFDLEIEDEVARMTGGTQLDRRDFGIGTEGYKDEKTVGFSVAVSVGLVAERSEP